MKHSFTSIKSILCKAALSCSLALVFAAGGKAYGTLDDDLAEINSMYPKTERTLTSIDGVIMGRDDVNNLIGDACEGMSRSMTHEEFAGAVLQRKPVQLAQYLTLTSFENLHNFPRGPWGKFLEDFDQKAAANFSKLLGYFKGEYIDFNFAWENNGYKELLRACKADTFTDTINIVCYHRHKILQPVR